MAQRRLRISFLLALFLLTGCRGTKAPEWSDAASHSTTIPFEFFNDHIFLKARINETAPVWFALDSGDKYAVIDTEKAKSLGVGTIFSLKAKGGGDDTLTAKVVTSGRYSLEGVKKFSQPLTLAFPMKRIAELIGHPVDGIIGSRFFDEFVVEIDYQKQLLTLHDKDKFVYSGSGVILPFTYNSEGHPLVEGQFVIGGQELPPGKFLVDLGAGDALVANTPFVNEHGLIKLVSKTAAVGSSGVGGFAKGRMGRIDGFRLGRWLMANPTVQFSQDSSGSYSEPGIEGAIGTEIMRRFRVFMDYSHHRIIVEPNTALEEPFLADASGIVWETAAPTYREYRVAKVLEDSPAQLAGLQVGDALVSIDGNPASDLSLQNLKHLLERQQEFNLEINREGTSRKLSLKTTARY